MKNVARYTVVGFVLLLSILASAQAADSPNCSNATLSGDYGFHISGEFLPAPGVVRPQSGVAMTHFDGSGNLSQLDFVVVNGQISGGPTNAAGFRTGQTGTYRVNDDCTGSARIGSGNPLQFIDLKLVVVNKGREVRMVVSDVQVPGSSGLCGGLQSCRLPANIISDGVRVDQNPTH